MKNSRILVISTLFICLLFPQISLANFDDINQATYQKEIKFLKKHNILKGYSNNTFRPNENISRAEFMTLALKALRVKTVTTTQQSFNDVNQSTWYFKYIETAKNNKWVTGYNNKFSPHKNINIADAVLIVSRIESWPKENKQNIQIPQQRYYSDALNYAANKKLINAAFASPGKELTRDQAAKLVFNLIYNNLKKQKELRNSKKSLNTNSDTTINSIPNTSEEKSLNQENNNTIPTHTNNQEPINLKTPTQNPNTRTFQIKKDSFSNISLNNNIPNTYKEGELFTFIGKNTNNTDKISLVIIDKDGEQEVITQRTNESGEFAISYIFPQQGTYKIGFLAGESGNIKIANITVTSNLLINEHKVLNSPTPINLIFENNKTYLIFNNYKKAKYIEIKQGDKSVTLAIRQYINKVEIPYYLFKDFSKDNIELYYYENDLSNHSKFLTNLKWNLYPKVILPITKHHFSHISPQLNVLNIPIKGSINTPIIFNLEFNQTDNIDSNIIIQTPSKQFEKYTFNISPNTTFSFTPKEKGTYIVEINNIEGMAILNHPIYIDTNLPILPNYKDLKPTQTSTLNIGSDIPKLLNLINFERQKLNLQEVVLDESLSILAQKHSNDMSLKNYFAHINLNGETPDDRRLKEGIPTSVGENLAKNTSLYNAHQGLVRSPAHYENILNPEWTRVGIGLTTSSDGYLIVVEEFSTNPINTNDLNILKNNILSEINILRKNISNPELTNNSNLNSIAQTWSDIMANEKSLNFTFPSPERSLRNLIETNNIQGNMNMYINNSSSMQLIKQSTIDIKSIINNNFQAIGIGLSIDNLGEIYQTILIK